MKYALIACEFSGIVREAVNAQPGWQAISCDLLPADDGGRHVQRDVLGLMEFDWDLIISFPPCTYLTSAGLHWNKKDPDRQHKTEQAVEFCKLLMSAPSPYIAMENPIGRLSTAYRKPDQIIQPHQFGADASKATCLWLKNLPKLEATNHVEPRWVNGKPRWSNQTDSGQNRLSPSPDRWKERSKTYPGIAQAMAEQWTAFIDQNPCL